MKTTLTNIAVIAGLALLGAIQSDEAAFGQYGPLIGAVAALAIQALSKYAPIVTSLVRAKAS